MFAERRSATSGSASPWAAPCSSGRLPPALLLTGPEGIGKKTLALAVARGLLCEGGPGEPLRRVHPLPADRAIHRGARRVARRGRRQDRRARPPQPSAPSRRDPGRGLADGDAHRDQGGPGPRPRGRGGGAALRGARPRLRDRRRPRDERPGRERPPQEPRGAAGHLPPDPRHPVAAGAAADDPVALPDAAHGAAAHGDRRGLPGEARGPRPRGGAPARQPGRGAAWARPSPSSPTTTASCATRSWCCSSRRATTGVRRAPGGGGAAGRPRRPHAGAHGCCDRSCATSRSCGTGRRASCSSTPTSPTASVGAVARAGGGARRESWPRPPPGRGSPCAATPTSCS